MMFSFLRKSQFIILLSLLGWLSILPISVKSQPLCFLITEDNQTIDLGGICGKKPPTQKSPTSKEKPLSFVATEKTEKFSFDATNKQFMRDLEGVFKAAEMEEKSQVPDFLKEGVSQERYENKPRCQFVAKNIEEDSVGLRDKCKFGL